MAPLLHPLLRSALPSDFAAAFRRGAGASPALLGRRAYFLSPPGRPPRSRVGTFSMLARSRPKTQNLGPLRTKRCFSNDGGGGKNPSGFFGWYNAKLESAPLLTKAITSGLIGAAGDIFAQAFIEEKSEFDLRRLGIFTFLGAALLAPVLHVWYGFLGSFVVGGGAIATAKRLFLDQALFGPGFIVVFWAALCTLEGRIGSLYSQLEDNWFNAVKTNWGLWIPAQIINFGFIPSLYQVLFANCVGCVWNAYLSYITHKGNSDE